MSSIIIQPSDQKELQFLLSLLEKMKISKMVIDEKELEDLGLTFAMREADRTKKTDEATIANLLKSKL